MPSPLDQTQVFMLLCTKCDSGAARPLDGKELLGMVTRATREFGDLLNRTCIQFPEYTFHDEHHAARVVLLMERILGEPRLNHLSVVDLALLILSAYGHDLGMAVGGQQREQHENSRYFKSFLVDNEDRWREVEEAREQADQARCVSLADMLYRDFLRSNHHRLSAEYILADCGGLLQVDRKSLASPVADLCRSHGEKVESLVNLKAFPFAGTFQSDLQLLACVLRLADALDLDSERAPERVSQAMESLSRQSQLHWRIHRASNFSVTPEGIHVQARFTDFCEEKALRYRLAAIEAERRACMELLHAQPRRNVSLSLHSPITCEIESVGYLYEEFQFELEYREIMSLLMGTRLYRDARVFLRELLQNALDACRHADTVASQTGRAAYAGKIVVRYYREQNGTPVVEVADNGTGMTRTVITEYFMRVGKSFYQSYRFRQQHLPFEPVSQFGIGILSCFMVSDYIEVETCPDPMAFPDESGRDMLALKLEIAGPYEFFVVRPLDRSAPGTTVRVFLREDLAESITGIVSRFVARCPYGLVTHDGKNAPRELASEGFDFSSDRFQLVFTKFPEAFGYAFRDLEFEGRFGFELTGRMRFFLLEKDGRRRLQLRDAGKYTFVGFTQHGETLITVRTMTPEVAGPLNESLSRAKRYAVGGFGDEVRRDLDLILQNFERLRTLLTQQHETREVTALWKALAAQTEALFVSPVFEISPASVIVREDLNRALREVESFVAGEVRLSPPTGVLTQDGINLSAIANLPAYLSLGIGYLYNLDLSGEFRLSLNVARDAVVVDKRSERLFAHLYQRVGHFLGTWFQEEGIPPDQVQQYLGSVPKHLAASVRDAYHQ